MLRETKTALIWLAVAAVFCGGAVTWKWNTLFGVPTTSLSHETATSRRQSAAFDAFQAPSRLVAPPSQSATSTKTEIHRVAVLDSDTKKPIVGARVVWMNRAGRALSDDASNQGGIVDARLHDPGTAHGVAAWHPRYRVEARVSNATPTEIHLTPVEDLRVSLRGAGRAREAWLRSAHIGATLEFARGFNPVRADAGFLEFKMYESMALRDHVWPLRGGHMRIPKYLSGLARLTLLVRQSLPNHLDASGLRAATPPAIPGAPVSRAGPIDVPPGTVETAVEIPPRSEHAIMARYSRARHPGATVLLHLAYTQRDPTAKDRGSIVTLRSELATYEERGDDITFRVFDLDRQVYHPTLLVFVPGRPRVTIPCNPIFVDGHTETDLSPLELADLTIRLRSAGGNPAGYRVLFLDPEMNLIPPLPAPRKVGSDRLWNGIPPVEYRILGLSIEGDRSSSIQVIRLKPGQHRALDLDLRPARRIALLTKNDHTLESIVLRDMRTRAEQFYPRGSWETHFVVEPRQGDVLRMTGRRHELLLVLGRYEIDTVRQGEKTTQSLTVGPETEVVTLH